MKTLRATSSVRLIPLINCPSDFLFFFSWLYLNMFKKAFVFTALLSIISCSEFIRHMGTEELQIKNSKGFPRWLKVEKYSPSQTSGITFIGRDMNTSKVFLLADDVGEIHYLKINQDTIFNLIPVSLSSGAQEFLSEFPKADFEEIVYDKFSGSVFISIEGNNDPEKYTGIFKINFENGNLFSGKIESFQKIAVLPEELFLKFAGDNTGYEGIAADSEYLYLGLEGFIEKGFFADSTLILIVGKKDLQIKKIIGTGELGIQTICGLYSFAYKDIIGIDRNKRQLFRLIFDEKLRVKKIYIKDIDVHIPSFPAFTYVASLESVSMDDENNIFLVDDPWKQFFVPSAEILKKLDTETVKNFSGFVPIIYKFKFDSSEVE